MGSLEGKAVETIWAKLSATKPTMIPPNQIESQPIPQVQETFQEVFCHTLSDLVLVWCFFFKGAHSKMHIH